MAACTHCPFAFSDESEYVQNLGCLPSPWDIIQMKKKSGHNWSCHSNDKKICSGFVEFINDYPTDKYSDIDISTGGLIKYKTWYHEGEETALVEVDKK